MNHWQYSDMNVQSTKHNPTVKSTHTNKVPNPHMSGRVLTYKNIKIHHQTKPHQVGELIQLIMHTTSTIYQTQPTRVFTKKIFLQNQFRVLTKNSKK